MISVGKMFVGACAFSALSIQAQIFLTDDFSGPALDSSKWITILPTGSSSVVQSGGAVTTTARGILGSVAGFSGSYEISGSFTMLDDLEHFNLAFRTDLSQSSSFERAGMFVSFSNDGNEVSIQRFTSASDWTLLSGTTLALNTGQSYSFSITDTGSLITLRVDGVDLLTATSDYSTGSRIGFYSRDFPSTATRIDSITVSAVPEPAAYAAVFGVFCLFGGWVFRKRLN